MVHFSHFGPPHRMMSLCLRIPKLEVTRRLIYKAVGCDVLELGNARESDASKGGYGISFHVKRI